MYNTTANYTGKEKQYRYTIDESRGSSVAKVQYEYFSDHLNAWTEGKSWNTRERLYLDHKAAA